MPRLRAQRCMNASSSASTAAAAAAPSRGGGPNQYSARQPSRCTCHGSPWSRDHDGDAVGERARRAGSASRSPRPQTSRRGWPGSAASESALPASVPPMPLTSIRGAPSAPAAARRARGHAVRRGGHATADRLADHQRSRGRGPCSGAAAGPGAEGVGLVDARAARRARRVSSRTRVEEARARGARCRCW